MARSGRPPGRGPSRGRRPGAGGRPTPQRVSGPRRRSAARPGAGQPASQASSPRRSPGRRVVAGRPSGPRAPRPGRSRWEIRRRNDTVVLVAIGSVVAIAALFLLTPLGRMFRPPDRSLPVQDQGLETPLDTTPVVSGGVRRRAVSSPAPEPGRGAQGRSPAIAPEGRESSLAGTSRPGVRHADSPQAERATRSPRSSALRSVTGFDSHDAVSAKAVGRTARPGEDLLTLKLERTDPKDAEALFELARWCGSDGRRSWAEKLYRRVLELGESKVRSEAAFRLALIERARGDFEAAYARLRPLARQDGHAAAREILRQATTRETERQRELAGEARELYEKGEFTRARRRLVEAFELTPSEPGDLDFIPVRELLLQIARFVRKIDDDHYRKVIQPVERSVRPCERKACEGGFVRCEPCGGDGILRVRRFAVKGNVPEFCKDCNRAGVTFCPTCAGLEYTTDDELLGDEEREAFSQILGKVRRPSFAGRSLEWAIRDIEEIILEVDRSATLSYFRSMKPGYRRSGELKKAIGSLPISSRAMDAAGDLWKRTGSLLDRVNFLLSYTIDFSRHLRGYDMLRGVSPRPSLGSLPDLAAAKSEAISPAILSAFPDVGKSSWLAVKGIFTRYEERPGEPEKARVSVEGEIPHDVHFFLWLPPARESLESLERGPWSSRVRRLPGHYPFDVRDTFASAPVGRGVVLLGRLLRDRLGHPRNWFEVWAAEFGLNREQEALLATLSEPVDLSFRPREARTLGALLGWYGLEVEFDDVAPDQLVRGEAHGCSVGVLVDEIARALESEWHLEGRQVIFAAHAPAGARADLDVVLERLRARGGDVLVRTGGADLATPGRFALPEDPAELRRTAGERLEAMDHAVALQCYERLLELVAEKDRGEIRRSMARARLCHELTRRTPVSQLAEGRNLHDIVQGTPDEELRRTVKIVRRDAESIWIQTAYGAELRLKAGDVDVERAVSASEWRERKEAELNSRAGEVAGSAQERVLTLLSLALFAKTNGFAGRGADFLESLLENDEFPWLLEACFPGRSSRLTSLWKAATDRAEPEPVAAAADPGDPPPPLEPLPLEPVDPRVPADPDELGSFALKHYGLGREHHRRSFPGMDGASRHRKAAVEHYRVARDAARKHLESHPDDGRVRKLARESTALVQICLKDMSFFD